VVGGEPLQGTDGQRIVNKVPAARGLTRVGANSPDDTGYGKSLLDQAHGFTVRPPCDEREIALNVNSGRACDMAGRNAIAMMLGQKHFQGLLAGGDNPVIVCPEVHAVCYACVTGGNQAMAFQLYDTHLTGTNRVQLLVLAEGRDMNAMFPAYFQDGLFAVGKNFLSVQSYSCYHLFVSPCIF
jgi:hypothetical protein